MAGRHLEWRCEWNVKRLLWVNRVVRGIRCARSQFLYCSSTWQEEGKREGLPPLGPPRFLLPSLPLALPKRCRGPVPSSWWDLPSVSDRATDWSACDADRLMRGLLLPLPPLLPPPPKKRKFCWLFRADEPPGDAPSSGRSSSPAPSSSSSSPSLPAPPSSPPTPPL